MFGRFVALLKSHPWWWPKEHGESYAEWLEASSDVPVQVVPDRYSTDHLRWWCND